MNNNDEGRGNWDPNARTVRVGNVRKRPCDPKKGLPDSYNKHKSPNTEHNQKRVSGRRKSHGVKQGSVYQQTGAHTRWSTTENVSQRGSGKNTHLESNNAQQWHPSYQNYSNQNHFLTHGSLSPDTSRVLFVNEPPPSTTQLYTNSKHAYAGEFLGYSPQTSQYQQNFFGVPHVPGHLSNTWPLPPYSNFHQVPVSAATSPTVNMVNNDNTNDITTTSVERHPYPQALFEWAPPLPPESSVPSPISPPPPPPETSVPSPISPLPPDTPPLFKSTGDNSKLITHYSNTSEKLVVLKDQKSGPSASRIIVGKRRGGKVLPTGIIKRPNSNQAQKQTNDITARYKAEVSRYKNQTCSDDVSKRPLVK